MSRKNFSIQAFRQQPGVDQAAAQKLWSSLRTAIGEIYCQNASSLSFEELYRNAYNLVLHKHFDLLYEGVRSTIRDHLTVSLVEIASASDEDFLNSTVGAWSFHVVAFNMMKDILMYMDRSYAQPRRKATTYTMALQLFREVILYDASGIPY
jgi:cullin 3